MKRATLFAAWFFVGLLGCAKSEKLSCEDFFDEFSGIANELLAQHQDCAKDEDCGLMGELVLSCDNGSRVSTCSVGIASQQAAAFESRLTERVRSLCEKIDETCMSVPAYL